MMNGRYYVGHDIDQQLEFINSHNLPIGHPYKDKRKETFMVATLGELNGWSGVRKKLNLFIKTGKI
jgi:hypothetical protein